MQSKYLECLANNTTSKRQDVTVCVRLNLPKQPNDDEKHAKHMTITYLGDAPSDNVYAALEQLAEQLTGSINLQVTGHDMFGKFNDIPVLRLAIMDEQVKELFDNFHRQFGVAESGMTKLETPNYHCSFKGSANACKALVVGTKLTACEFAVKRVGPVDPFYSKQLNMVM